MQAGTPVAQITRVVAYGLDGGVCRKLSDRTIETKDLKCVKT